MAFGVNTPVHDDIPYDNRSHSGDRIIMKNALTFGIAFLVMGAAVVGFDYFSHATTDQVLQMGTLMATTEKTRMTSLSSILGWLMVGGGACALILGAWLRKN